MFKVPNQYRITSGKMASSLEDGNNGAFEIPIEKHLTGWVIVSDGQGWEHVSVHLRYKKKAEEVIKNSEIVLILTEWPEFRKLDYRNKIVIDGKNVFNKKKPKNYEGICW